MKILKVGFFIIICLFNFSAIQLYATGDLEKIYCGPAVLSRAFENLGISSEQAEEIVEGLADQAQDNQGANSLYEIKLAAEKAGLRVLALKPDSEALPALVKNGQLIAYISDKRNFALLKGVIPEWVSLYVPGSNYEDPIMPMSQFKQSWSGVVLLVSRKDCNLHKFKGKYALVPDNNLKEISGGWAS
ncbi:MAG: cysteine peptidase family C39 domain-containing protein [Candidatus Omnitrophica bacterium]|nr:cysteine peptidase family C39 domain-containing protein [Candidatus Omnitrophota bacterium]